MITDFKIFESNNDKKFWTVKTDRFFPVRLYKIGMTFTRMSTYLYIMDSGAKDIYVGFDGELYTWIKYDYSRGNSLYEKNEYEYMGEVDVSDKDVNKYNEDLKMYNLKRSNVIKKYNL